MNGNPSLLTDLIEVPVHRHSAMTQVPPAAAELGAEGYNDLSHTAAATQGEPRRAHKSASLMRSSPQRGHLKPLHNIFCVDIQYAEVSELWMSGEAGQGSNVWMCWHQAAVAGN